jgi:hypothetical protein
VMEKPQPQNKNQNINPSNSVNKVYPNIWSTPKFYMPKVDCQHLGLKFQSPIKLNFIQHSLGAYSRIQRLHCINFILCTPKLLDRQRARKMQPFPKVNKNWQIPIWRCPNVIIIKKGIAEFNRTLIMRSKGIWLQWMKDRLLQKRHEIYKK